jgi:hypothetical protein
MGPDGAIYYSAINTGKVYRISEQTPSSLFTVTPCRIVDTRRPAGALGGPAIPASALRNFTLAGQCGVPSTARSVAVNVTVTLPSADGYVAMYPAGLPVPPTSLLNFRAGQTRANNAVIPLGSAGDVTVANGLASGTVHLIVDVVGYFQ